MTWILDERRRRRSQDRATALRYQLEHTLDRGRLEAVVLADASGLIVAAAGDPAICQELGALAPLLHRAAHRVPLPPLLRGAELAVRPMRLYGQELFLATMGGGVSRDALLGDSLRSLERILAAN